jgi:hypothetical protein
MSTNIASLVGDVLASLPAEGVERELALQKAAELAAAREALAALQSCAARASEDARTKSNGLSCASKAELDVLTAASELWRGTDFTWPASNPRALKDLRLAASSPEFLDIARSWVVELRAIAGGRPNSGACTTASALQLWLWTMNWFRRGPEKRDVAVAELAEALGALVSSRCLILEVTGGRLFFSVPETVLVDLCQVHAARSAGAVAMLCAELVHGYRLHPTWNSHCSSCYGADELDELEGLMPGIASAARGQSDVIESDGSHPPKAGPCVRFNEIEGFTRLRAKLDGCLTGARRASARAAAVIAELAPASPLSS